MRRTVFRLILLGLTIIAPLQQPGRAQEKRTIASVLDLQFTAAQQDLVGAAGQPQQPSRESPLRGLSKRPGDDVRRSAAIS